MRISQRTPDSGTTGPGRVDPIDALHLLRRIGFGGGRLFGARGNTTALHYRRSWRGVSDVVLVYSENDAEAYRADDPLQVDGDPLDLACRPDLLCEVVGTVAEVVAEVTTWPVDSTLPRDSESGRPAPGSTGMTAPQPIAQDHRDRCG
ncbi:hypothetical protein [Umezawaea sp. Da 62-37]|uniref:hypothetical protein n=1 Tax=Umezawaea sp. Da 62-37 TaxID=3075927 RepID=UPI0028F73C9E|nr:hypothetical protein [Umezawaea sp. Da 62-37]WNV87871.1 hypothetical protein RM788_06190 [Umezawaea sp. Da 62-37]